MTEQTLGLYLHIPFCRERCSYCDFLTFPHAEALLRPYLEALAKEIRLWKREREKGGEEGLPVDTIYLGGGTPSLLKADELRRLFREVHEAFPISPRAEITMEMNPEAEGDARVLRALGINRISLGMQTSSPRLLAQCRRTHRSEDGGKTMVALRSAGFDNINVDLIYGLPGQTRKDLEGDLNWLAIHDPDHVSWYGLILEERSLLYQQVRQGTMQLPGEDVQADEFSFLLAELDKLGYRRYEISNFSKVGKQSRHNLKYWTGKPYLGLGLGASSYLNGERYHNPGTFQQYFTALRQGRLPREWEERTKKDDIFERIMMGLRRVEGISFRDFALATGIALESCVPKSMAKACRQGLGEKTADAFRLTRRGLDLQNRVLVDMMEEMEESL